MASAEILGDVLIKMACPANLSADQVLSALEHIERSIPGSDLRYLLTPEARSEPILDRVALVREGLELRNGFDSSFRGLHNSIDARLFSFTAEYLVNFAVEDYWLVCFDQPPDALPPERMTSFLLGLGDALAAHYGTAGTYLAGTAYDQLNHEKKPDFAPPHGLPEIFFPNSYVSMALPLNLSWANYWSPRTAEILGFSESEHARLFHRWQRGVHGSLAFQLTPEPIDLARFEDIEALKCAYEAFPGVGGRDPKFRLPDEDPEDGEEAGS